MGPIRLSTPPPLHPSNPPPHVCPNSTPAAASSMQVPAPPSSTPAQHTSFHTSQIPAAGSSTSSSCCALARVPSLWLTPPAPPRLRGAGHPSPCCADANGVWLHLPEEPAFWCSAEELAIN